MNELLRVSVAAINQLAPDIKEFILRPVVGSELPAFSPGSHIILEIHDAKNLYRNAYSLTSSPFDRSHYRIAVQLQQDSRGGSRYLHQAMSVGDQLDISPPNNYFAFEQYNKKCLLIAGGIGVTPFMSLFPDKCGRNADIDMHYVFRDQSQAAFVSKLRDQLGGRLSCYQRSQGQRLDVARLLSEQPLGTHVYVCGPERLIEDVRHQATMLGWPESTVHFEKFAVATNGAPFSVRLKKTGRSIKVAEDESLLDALHRNGVEVRHLCRAGVCGECKTALLQGPAEHRDLYLADAEKSEFIMPCVSRARNAAELVLDL